MYKKVQPVAKKPLSETLPRRKAEQLKYCYGLDQVELGHTKPDPCHALASKLWENSLRHTWRKFHPPHHDYGFVPSSLSEYSIRVIRKHGVAGIHYAEGWEGLYNMYIMCGEDLTDYQPEPTKEMIERKSTKPAQNGGRIKIKEEALPESSLPSAVKSCENTKKSDPLMFLSAVAEKTGSKWGDNTAGKSQNGKKDAIEVDLDAVAPPVPGVVASKAQKKTTKHTNEAAYDDETLVPDAVASHHLKRLDPPSSPLLLQMKKRRVSRPPERYASLRQVSLTDVHSYPDEEEEESECPPSPPPPPLFYEQPTPTQNGSNFNDNDTTASKTDSDDDSSDDDSSDDETSSEATEEEIDTVEERLAKMERRIAHLEREIQKRDDLLAAPTLMQSSLRQKQTLSERIDNLEKLYAPKKKSRRVNEGNTGTERVTRLEMILFDCVQPGGLVSRVERLEEM